MDDAGEAPEVNSFGRRLGRENIVLKVSTTGFEFDQIDHLFRVLD